MCLTNNYVAAEKLRREGESYTRISNKLGIAESTLSSWFSTKPWSKEITLKLDTDRKRRSNINLLAANKARVEIQNKRRESYFREAQFEFNKLIGDPLFLIGIGIYWGEGDKTSNGRVGVINTDPELLHIVAKFYRQCLGVEEGNLRVGLFVYEDIDRDTAVTFWSDKLKVPKHQFIKIQLLKSRSRLTKSKSKYGICSLYCSSTKLSIKIHEWIRLLSIHEFTNWRV